MPKISILIAIYNGANSFEKSIGSLLAQTLKDIEIVCVNDNSTDNSLELLYEYQKEDSRIKIVSFKENMGTICARKAGVENATGEYIMFMDQDDQFETYACEELYNMIKEKNVDIINFRSKVIAIPPTTEKQRKWQEDFMQPYDGYLYGDDVFGYCFNPIYETGKTWSKYTWNVWNKIYKTDVCKRAMLECAEDYVVNGDDMYVYMLISYYAKSYYGDANGKFYHIYSLGSGLMGNHKLGLRRFYTLARRGKSVDNEVKFFKDKDIDKYQEAIDLDFARAICGIVQRWYSRLEDGLRPEGYDMIHEYMDDISIISGLHKHVNVGHDKIVSAIKGAKTVQLKRVYVKTVAFYFSEENKNDLVDDNFLKKCRNAGYKIICITEEGKDISKSITQEDIFFIPCENKDTNVCTYGIKDRMSTLKRIIEDNHIDALVYLGNKTDMLVYDMLMVKGLGSAFIIENSVNSSINQELLQFSDGVISNKTMNDRVCTVSYEDAVSVFEKMLNYQSTELYELLNDKKLRRFYKKRALKKAFSHGNFVFKIKLLIKLMLRLVGIKKDLHCDQYDDYNRLVGLIKRK